jgi:hypothetical protein
VLGAYSQLYSAWKYGVDCGGVEAGAEDGVTTAPFADGTAGAEDGLEASAEEAGAPMEDASGDAADKAETGEGNIVAPAGGKLAS